MIGKKKKKSKLLIAASIADRIFRLQTIDCELCNENTPEQMERPRLPTVLNKKGRAVLGRCDNLAFAIGYLTALIEQLEDLEPANSPILLKARTKLSSLEREYADCVRKPQ